MFLSKISLQGFRNFKEAEINFRDKVLIIGPNEIGKTNLIWAIRLLLDKNLSESEREPRDSDFYAFEETDKFRILLEFSSISEECILSRLKENVSDDGKLYLLLEVTRNPATGIKNSAFYLGPNLETLAEIEERYYLRVLNLNYIGSRRDFFKFVTFEKGRLLQDSKEARTAQQIEQDSALEAEIVVDISSLDGKIPRLSYIANATTNINDELAKLSIQREGHRIVFDASSSDINSFIGNVGLAARSGEKSLGVGGDGRLNQVYLCLWAARHARTLQDQEQVSLVCVEEPEAHLHPHQQRKLAEYLNQTLPGQVIMTTHSPQIASEFSPNSIVRLLQKGSGTTAASSGCSEIIAEAFDDFGYRMSIIPAEAFFADVVFLVEGPSEEQFYKTLSRQIGLDLDHLNISVLSVAGVGFEVFVKILSSLEIEWVLRTDNDISKIPKKAQFRMAGVLRLISCYEASAKRTEEIDATIERTRTLFSGLDSREVSAQITDALIELGPLLNRKGFFLSAVDLETDLFESSLKEDLITFYDGANEDEIIKEMKKSKAVSMYEFLKLNKAALSKLKDDPVSLPLHVCKSLIA